MASNICKKVKENAGFNEYAGKYFIKYKQTNAIKKLANGPANAVKMEYILGCLKFLLSNGTGFAQPILKKIKQNWVN